MSDAVSLQLEIRVRVPKGFSLSREFLDQVVREWAEEGDTPSGIEVRIVDWKRGGRAYKATDQDDARAKFRRLLQEGRFAVDVRAH